MRGTKFKLIVRVFAPFKVFGLAFHGDNRGPTTSSCATARIHAFIEFDPAEGTIGPPMAYADPSYVAGTSITRTATPQIRVSGIKTPGGLFIQLDGTGANPLLPSPDIDFRLRMNVSVAAQRLNLSAALTGDRFPSFEVMIQDAAGKRQMVQTYMTDGGKHTGPAARLFGNRQLDMNALCASYGLNAQGNFQ